MRLMITLLLGCGLFFGAAMTATAQPPYQEYPGYGAPLTQEQIETARRIINDNYADMESTRQELSGKRALLDAQLASPNPDRNAIERLSREIGDLRGKMLSARATVRSELAKRGLPADLYAPNSPYYDNEPPQMWHHGGRYRGHGGWHRGHGGWGRGYGCPGGCW